LLAEERFEFRSYAATECERRAGRDGALKQEREVAAGA